MKPVVREGGGEQDMVKPSDPSKCMQLHEGKRLEFQNKYIKIFETHDIGSEAVISIIIDII